MMLLERPHSVSPRPGETIIWTGSPCWQTLAKRAFHIGGISLYLCALIFANALAGRLQHLSQADILQGELPVAIFAAIVLAATAALAWATARTTRYTLTNQRIVLQYGLAINATLALPMRLVRSVSVSNAATGDVVIKLKPGNKIAYAKLWPHLRPWRFAQPEPALRALPNAAAAAALISRTVAAAQAQTPQPATSAPWLDRITLAERHQLPSRAAMPHANAPSPVDPA